MSRIGRSGSRLRAGSGRTLVATSVVVVFAAGLAAAAMPIVASGSIVAHAASPAQSVYVGNAGSSVTGYPLTASGNAAPVTDLSQSSNVGSVEFDGAGDLWVGEGSGSSNNAGVIEEYSPSQLGSVGSVTPATMITASVGVNSGSAFDHAGDLWFASFGGGSVSEFSAGQLTSSGSKTPAVTVGGLTTPNGIAFDASGDLWVSSFQGDTLSEFTPAELAASGSPTPAVVISSANTALDGPARLTFDAAGNLWVANNLGDTIAEYSAAQLTATGSPTPATVLSAENGSLSEPNGLSFDASGNLWIVNESTDEIVEFSASQLTASGSPAPVDTIAGGATQIANPYVLTVGPSPSPSNPTTTTTSTPTTTTTNPTTTTTTNSKPGNRASFTSVLCNTEPDVANQSSCTATVGDAGAGASHTPTGAVNFTTNKGSFTSGSVCTLVPTPASPGVASCTVGYAVAPGTHPGPLPVVAHYAGDATFAASSGGTGFDPLLNSSTTVTATASGGVPIGLTNPNAVLANGTLTLSSVGATAANGIRTSHAIGAPDAGKSRVIGKVSFRIGRYKRLTVTVKLTASGRKLLKLRRKLTMTARLTLKAAKKTTVVHSYRLTVKAHR